MRDASGSADTGGVAAAELLGGSDSPRKIAPGCTAARVATSVLANCTASSSSASSRSILSPQRCTSSMSLQNTQWCTNWRVRRGGGVARWRSLAAWPDGRRLLAPRDRPETPPHAGGRDPTARHCLSFPPPPTATRTRTPLLPGVKVRELTPLPSRQWRASCWPPAPFAWPTRPPSPRPPTRRQMRPLLSRPARFRTAEGFCASRESEGRHAERQRVSLSSGTEAARSAARGGPAKQRGACARRARAHPTTSEFLPGEAPAAPAAAAASLDAFEPAEIGTETDSRAAEACWREGVEVTRVGDGAGRPLASSGSDWYASSSRVARGREAAAEDRGNERSGRGHARGMAKGLRAANKAGALPHSRRSEGLATAAGCGTVKQRATFSAALRRPHRTGCALAAPAPLPPGAHVCRLATSSSTPSRWGRTREKASRVLVTCRCSLPFVVEHWRSSARANRQGPLPEAARGRTGKVANRAAGSCGHSAPQARSQREAWQAGRWSRTVAHA